MSAWQKAPDERLDYRVDFADWLSAGDTIVSADAAVESVSACGGPGTVALDGSNFEANAVTVWVTGGDDGDSAEITVTVTTAQGRIKDGSFRLRVRDNR